MVACRVLTVAERRKSLFQRGDVGGDVGVGKLVVSHSTVTNETGLTDVQHIPPLHPY